MASDRPRPASGAPRVAVVGATGAVGMTLLQLVEERAFEYSSFELIASPRSAGRTIEFGGAELVVRELDDVDFGAVDVAFFSAGTALSRIWAPRAAAEGALVVDNTAAFRMDPGTPLVVPQVNAAVLDRRPAGGIVANPNCSTIPLVRVLRPVLREWGAEQVVVSTYQAASGGGYSGIAELREDTGSQLAGPPYSVRVKEFPPGLAFNVIPFIDKALDDGGTVEERKMSQESAKILAAPELDVTATCVRVPVVNGHSEAVWIRTRRPAEREAVLAELAAQPDVVVHSSADPLGTPTPRNNGDPDRVHVGRVRVSPDGHGVWLWLVADNLRIGAALNAIQIAELLREKGLL
ncbi:aspartate-semialdehyde dehydrogenase [Saccharomonospora sp. NPDC006951]